MASCRCGRGMSGGARRGRRPPSRAGDGEDHVAALFDHAEAVLAGVVGTRRLLRALVVEMLAASRAARAHAFDPVRDEAVHVTRRDADGLLALLLASSFWAALRASHLAFFSEFLALAAAGAAAAPAAGAAAAACRLIGSSGAGPAPSAPSAAKQRWATSWLMR